MLTCLCWVQNHNQAKASANSAMQKAQAGQEAKEQELAAVHHNLEEVNQKLQVSAPVLPLQLVAPVGCLLCSFYCSLGVHRTTMAEHHALIICGRDLAWRRPGRSCRTVRFVWSSFVARVVYMSLVMWLIKFANVHISLTGIRHKHQEAVCDSEASIVAVLLTFSYCMSLP